MNTNFNLSMPVFKGTLQFDNGKKQKLEQAQENEMATNLLSILTEKDYLITGYKEGDTVVLKYTDSNKEKSELSQTGNQITVVNKFNKNNTERPADKLTWAFNILQDLSTEMGTKITSAIVQLAAKNERNSEDAIASFDPGIQQ